MAQSRVMDSQKLLILKSCVRETSCLTKTHFLLLEYECIRSPLLLRLPNRRSVESSWGELSGKLLKTMAGSICHFFVLPTVCNTDVTA